VSVRQLAVIAVIGPFVWLVIVPILTVLEWDFLRGLGWEPIKATDVPYPSSTALGPYGWLQILNFLQLGAALLALAAGLWRVLRPRARVGIGAIAALGVASLLSAFPTDGGMEIRSWHGAIHAAAFLLLVVSSFTAQIALGISLRRHAGWAAVSRTSLGAAVVAIGFAIAASVIEPLGSLFSSLVLVTLLVWIELMALRLFAATRPV
jgi:hypothetical protein